MRTEGHYYILRVWLPTEGRFWWHELFARRDWLGIIPDIDFEIWEVEEEVDALRIWPPPANAQAREEIRQVLSQFYNVPVSRAYKGQCRRRLRRLIRKQVGEQRGVDEWADIGRAAVAWVMAGKGDGKDFIEAGPNGIGKLMQRRRREIERHMIEQQQVQIKLRT